MTREQQIEAALHLLAPPPEECDRCRAQIEQALDIMASAARAVEHAKITPAELRAETKALEGLQEHAVTLRPIVDRMVDKNREWSAHWSPPSPALREKYAVALAHDLLTIWGVQPTLYLKGAWHRLAAALYGVDSNAKMPKHFRRQMHAFLDKGSPGIGRDTVERRALQTELRGRWVRDHQK